MRPIRVLHVRSCRGITHITGTETHLLSLMQGLDPQCCKCSLICITDPRQGETPWLQELKRRGLPFVTIPVRHRLSFRDITTFPIWIRRFQADIVHSHDHRADIVGIAGAKVTGRPALASCHGWTAWPADSTRGRVYPWLDRQALRHADAIIANSAASATQVDQGEKGTPVVVIPHGVDTKKFNPAHVKSSLRSRFFPGPNILVLGMVARIHPNKGQLEFLKAAAGLSRSRPGCRFLIVGDALPGYEDYKWEVMRFIADNGLERIVSVINVSHDEIPAVMASIDILVAPSHMEPFGLSLLEAMAMEKPVVATRVGGIPEVITDGETGLLVPPGDWGALGRVLGTLIDDPERRTQLGRQALQKVRVDFSFEVMVARTMRVYQEMIGWRHQKSHSSKRAQLRERLSGIVAP